MPSEVFIKEPSKRTPGVMIKPGKVFIMGRSIPDNPAEFYEPVLKSLPDMIMNPEKQESTLGLSILIHHPQNGSYLSSED